MNLKQYAFVTGYLHSGDHIQAYKNAYQSTSDYKTIESAANRLLCNPEVAKTIHDAQASIRERVEQELAAQLKTELLTMQRKRELLYRIATGEMCVEQNYKGRNCSQCAQYVRPTINQMLKAIDLDNKLAGHYGNKITSPLGRGWGGSAHAGNETANLPFRGLGGKPSPVPTAKKENPAVSQHHDIHRDTAKTSLPFRGIGGIDIGEGAKSVSSPIGEDNGRQKQPSRHAELHSASRETPTKKEKPEETQHPDSYRDTTNTKSPLQGDRGTTLPACHAELHSELDSASRVTPVQEKNIKKHNNLQQNRTNAQYIPKNKPQYSLH